MSGSVDVVVAGLGGMGSAAAWQLARRGVSVCGLDANAPGHELGSSHGTSRIIRQAYPDGGAYVPLVRRATELWERIEAEAGRRVLHRVGAVAIAPPEERRIAGGLRSASEHGIALELLGGDELVERFPAFRPPDGAVAVYEPGAGYLEPEAGVAAMLGLAEAAGADLRFGEPVVEWGADGDGVVVTTAAGTVLRAARLVLAVGPWSPELLGASRPALPLRVERRVNVHFQPARPELFGPDRLPVFNLVVPEGQFYGFGVMDDAGVKVGRHDADAPCTPSTVRRRVDDGEVAELRAALDRYVPGAAGTVLRRVTCLYTQTPDGHFVLGRHPELPQVTLFAGCSGHAFKFAPVVGEVLADLAVDGDTRHDVGFLAPDRFVEAAA